MPPVILGPRCNRRVTCDASPSNARSESAVAVSPLDPHHMVAASKRFTSPATYAFSNAVYATFDGGLSWTESAPLTLPAGWAGTSDPAVSFDNLGNAYLLALPFGPGSPGDYVGPILGMAVYKSSDGGRTWGAPALIHSSNTDDKQWMEADESASSPHYGNVYGAWHSAGQLIFTRSTDHGATWRGVGAQPSPSPVPGVADCFAPEISVAGDGSIYIVWLGAAGVTTPTIKFVKSQDGGGSFTTPQLVASGITLIPLKLPSAKFRTFTLPTGCAGSGNVVVFAWADYREGVSRIYYRRSNNGGNSFTGSASGEPLLTGAVASGADQHDFHPQLMATPDGEIGCAFYEYGPKGGDPEFAPKLIDVILAVSTNNGSSFADRVTVTEQAWDPTVNEVYAHGDPNTTFIGEYFGLDASRLGFFPLWTDTRTGVQQLYVARVAVNPADVYIRDSSADMGGVPSPGFHWEAPDLIVRRAMDGATTFVSQDIQRDGVTDHYIYGRVRNNGPNAARNVRLAVTIGNWPSLIGLPGSEFRYPQDWYPGDWTTTALQANHRWLGESAPVANLPNGHDAILGPVAWPASMIPAPGGTWHPCVLAEVRADNDDSGGGTLGCSVDADPDPCIFGAFFWGNNNVCQRNLSYAPVLAGLASFVELPFIVGSAFSRARFLEVVVEKAPELVRTPMTLRMEPIALPHEPRKPPCGPGELVWKEDGRVVVRVGECEAGEIVPAPGTVWRPHCPPAHRPEEHEICFGGEKAGPSEWRLLQPRASVGVAVAPGELRKMTLSFHAPATLEPGARPLIRIFQRTDRRLITGSVMLQLEVSGEGAAEAVEPAPERGPRRAARKRREG